MDRDVGRSRRTGAKATRHRGRVPSGDGEPIASSWSPYFSASHREPSTEKWTPSGRSAPPTGTTRRGVPPGQTIWARSNSRTFVDAADATRGSTDSSRWRMRVVSYGLSWDAMPCSSMQGAVIQTTRAPVDDSVSATAPYWRTRKSSSFGSPTDENCAAPGSRRSWVSARLLNTRTTSGRILASSRGQRADGVPAPLVLVADAERLQVARGDDPAALHRAVPHDGAPVLRGPLVEPEGERTRLRVAHDEDPGQVLEGAAPVPAGVGEHRRGGLVEDRVGREPHRARRLAHAADVGALRQEPQLGLVERRVEARHARVRRRLHVGPHEGGAAGGEQVEAGADGVRDRLRVVGGRSRRRARTVRVPAHWFASTRTASGS